MQIDEIVARLDVYLNAGLKRVIDYWALDDKLEYVADLLHRAVDSPLFVKIKLFAMFVRSLASTIPNDSIQSGVDSVLDVFDTILRTAEKVPDYVDEAVSVLHNITSAEGDGGVISTYTAPLLEQAEG